MSYEIEWKKCDPDTARALLSGAANPGQVFEFDAQRYLPKNIASGMKGVEKMYVSGLCPAVPIAADATIAVDMAAVRFDGDKGKAYRWLAAVSGMKEEPTVLFGAIFNKGFTAHHFEAGKAIPVEAIFEKANPKLPKP